MVRMNSMLYYKSYDIDAYMQIMKTISLKTNISADSVDFLLDSSNSKLRMLFMTLLL